MKKKFIFFAVLLLTIMGGVKLNVLNAQETVVIGDGTAINLSDVPCKTNYDNTLSQQIFLADDFDGKTGNITSYAFKCAKDLASQYSGYTCNFKIYMTNTDKTSFESVSDYVNMSLESLVFEGVVSFQPAGEWTIINFDTPFEYEEGKNVLLCITNASPYINVSMNYYSHSTTEYRSISTYKDGSTPFDVTNITPSIDKKANTNVTHSQFTFESSAPAVMPSSVPEITSIEATHNSVTLAWNAVENAKKYNVYTSTGDLVTTVSTTSCTIEGLNGSTEYCYQVTAANGEFETGKSTERCATTLEAPINPFEGKQFRIKVMNGSYAGYYLNINTHYYPGQYVSSYITDSQVGVAQKFDYDGQIFTIEDDTDGHYYLKSADGYYIKCDYKNNTYNGNWWSVYAYSSTEKTPLVFEYDGENFYIRDYDKMTNNSVSSADNTYMPANSYFKVQDAKVYCDAPINLNNGESHRVVLWSVEELAFMATATASSEEIYDDQTTTLSITAMDGSGNYTYSWSPIEGLNDATSTNPTFSPSAPGEYTFTCTVTDTESGSTAEASVTVYVYARPALQLTVSADKGLIYNDGETAALTATVTVGTGYAPYTYSWTLNGEAIEGATEATYTFSNTTVGEYTLTCTVTDARNNTQTDSKTIEVKDASEKPLEIVLGTPGSLTTYHPTSPLYENSYSQQIYTASEINSSACDITNISFMKYNNTALLRNIKVFMLNVNKDSFTSNSDWVSVSDSDVVFEGSFDFAGDKGEWTTIELTNKFSYTGGDILLCVNDNTGEWKNDYPQFYSYGVDEYRSLSSRRDNSSFPDVMSGSANFYEKSVNHIKLGYELPAPKPENLVASPAQIHVGETTTLTWNEFEGAASYNIYVNGEFKANTTELSYELSGLTYNVNGNTIEVIAVDENGTEISGKAYVTVQVAGTFPLTVNVKDSQGNAIEGATVTINVVAAYDQFYNPIEEVEPMTTDAEGNATVTLPLLGSGYYIVTASKSPFNDYVDYVQYYSVSNNTPYSKPLTLSLPTPSGLYPENYEYLLLAGDEFILNWNAVDGATSYNVYREVFSASNYSYDYVLLGNVTTNTYASVAEYDAEGSNYAVTAVFEGGLESDLAYTYDMIRVLGTGAVEGVVKDEDGNLVAGAALEFSGTNAFGEDIHTLTTAADGSFRIEDVIEGTYSLTVSHSDYLHYVYGSDIIVTYNATNELEIVLVAKPTPQITNVTATANDTYANVTWTGSYEKYNVYRRNIENPQELELLAGETSANQYADYDWSLLDYGTYQYGVSTFVEPQAKTRGTEVIFEEGFENNGTSIPTGWSKTGYGGITNSGSYRYSGICGYYLGGGVATSTLTSPEIDLTNYSSATLSFYYWTLNNLTVKVKVSGGNWNVVSSPTKRNSFEKLEISLSEGYAGNIIQIQFEDVSTDWEYTALDDILVFSESSAIESQIVWSNEVVKQAPNTFEGTVSDAWNVKENWSNGKVPTEGEDVIVNANAVISGNVALSTLDIVGDGSVTVNANASLTVSGKITQEKAYSLIMNDGAQVFQNNANVTAQFNMNLVNPTNWSSSNKDGWQFISSPLSGVSVTNIAEGNYDLYKYNGLSELEWLNHKDVNFADATYQHHIGYLASHETKTTLEFKGTLNTKDYYGFYEYVDYYENEPLKNFHLIGNPYPYNISWADFANSVGFYNGYAYIKDDGNYEYATSGTIAPGDGFFVKATGVGEYGTYYYYLEGSGQTRSQKQNNSLNITATGKAGKDNVVINLAGKSEGFDKLQNFNDEIATVYVAENGKNYGIYNCDADVQEVELSFNANQMGNYTIAAQPKGEFEMVTLVDKFTGIETNLLLEDYTFTATSHEANNRFVVKFVNGQQTTDNGRFVYQSGEELIINAQGMIQIVDVLGRVVYQSERYNDINRVGVENFDDATYVVRCVNGNEVKTQKIVIL